MVVNRMPQYLMKIVFMACTVSSTMLKINICIICSSTFCLFNEDCFKTNIKGPHSKGRLKLKYLTVTNTLAYCYRDYITLVKSFMVEAFAGVSKLIFIFAVF
jgi:hypothetical protein